MICTEDFILWKKYDLTDREPNEDYIIYGGYKYIKKFPILRGQIDGKMTVSNYQENNLKDIVRDINIKLLNSRVNKSDILKWRGGFYIVENNLAEEYILPMDMFICKATIKTCLGVEVINRREN